ncbi:MAG: TA system VapC family ribonuclease toxin [Acidimicrobiales bacterium]
MILPDVNVLVYAFRREAESHERYAAWLADLVTGSDELALHDLTLLGFVRIVTNRRIVATPAPTGLALDFVTRLRTARRARWLPAGSASWERFGEMAGTDRAIAANLVPDAFIAGLARTHGCRLATADRGFARYPGLNWFDPAA